MDGVQKKVAQWKIQPKECVWSQGGWTEDSKAPLIKESDIEREHKRLMNIIEDLQDKVTALEKEPMKKIIREEREVRKQIFK
jgi:hypothetical protein